MDGLSKTLDSAIKAPLWFWFAIMIASGIPMFRIPNLVEIGISADYKLFGVPLALIALTSTALFLASASARSWTYISDALGHHWERAALMLSLRGLSPDARALLHVMEDEDHSEFTYDPDDPVLRYLRDRGYVTARLVGEDRTWGTFNLMPQYENRAIRHRAMVRRSLRSSHDAVEHVRQTMKKADRAAHRY